MQERIIGRMLAPLQRAIANMAARATVALVNSAGRIQRVQMRLLNGEAKQSLDHFEAYGLTSNPHPGAEGLALFLAGDRSHGVVINIGDRRYRLTSLAPGEVALYDDLGQKVHLTRTGIVIDGAGLPMLLTNTPLVRMETPQLEVTGEIKDRCDTDGRTMSGMRSIYNSHTHPENDSGGPTDQPNQSM